MKGRDRRLREQGAQGLVAQWEGPEAGLQGWATRPPHGLLEGRCPAASRGWGV